MVDMSVRIGTLELKNPVMPGSGTFAEGLDKVMDLNRLGAIVTKTVTPDIREGCPPPRVVEYRDATLMAIGIPCKGPEHYVNEIVRFYRRFETPLIASISAPSVEEFARLASYISVPGVAAIEANISCPNLKKDGRSFSMDCEATEHVIRAMKGATDRPIWAKLTPNVTDIAAVAQARSTNWRATQPRTRPGTAPTTSSPGVPCLPRRSSSAALRVRIRHPERSAMAVKCHPPARSTAPTGTVTTARPSCSLPDSTLVSTRVTPQPRDGERGPGDRESEHVHPGCLPPRAPGPA